MAKIYENISELIGSTPLLRLHGLENKKQLSVKILAKLECFNPGGSAKDRVALSMIEEAEKSGKLKSDSVIIEPTSGNTGIGLAMVAVSKGYKAIIVMPESMSEERRKLISAYGAELCLTEASKGMSGAIAKAEELAKEIPNSIIAGQFENPANPKAHFNTTGPEIYADTDGLVDIFISAVGTGGTITGAGEYLKKQNPNIKIIAVEPEASAVLSGKSAGTHKIQGIGAGFIPKTLNTSIYDEVITVSDEEAFTASRLVTSTDGILVGISSGAAICAAIKLAERPENKDKNIVVLLPDTGERYLSVL